jgi:hypothetical protein
MVRIAIALLLLVPSVAVAQEISGDSDEFAVAVDRDSKVITGYYNSSTGYDDATKAPRFSCVFYLRGKVEGKPPYKIVTWFPADHSEVIDGTLDFSSNASAHSVTIRLKEEHGGCWNVQQFATKEGATLTLDRTGTWSSVRVAAARKTNFYSSASATQAMRSFVTTGDALKVSSTKPGWVQATFTNGDNKSTQGWIRETDLFPSSLAP